MNEFIFEFAHKKLEFFRRILQSLYIKSNIYCDVIVNEALKFPRFRHLKKEKEIYIYSQCIIVGTFFQSNEIEDVELNKGGIKKIKEILRKRKKISYEWFV